jgi:hypothetical protein
MGRLRTIEETAASGLPQYNNLKIIVRGKPRFIDPQLDGGILRFAIKRGFNFSAIIPDNQVELGENAYKDSYQIIMESRPSWIEVGTLIRLGSSEAIGELHIVNDLLDSNGIGIVTPLISNYSASKEQDVVPVVSLIGTPSYVYTASADPRIMYVDSWHPIVPADVLLMSKTPDVLESYQEYEIKIAFFIGTRAGIGDEPPTIYQFRIELNTKTGLLPFIPEVGLRLFLKALPLFFRGEWGSGDIPMPDDVGPCVLDAFFGSLLDTNTIVTKLGLRTWDAFGSQSNFSTQQWQEIPSNYLLLERHISSDALLFWQRITGNFQYQKAGYFQAELNEEGKFSFSTGLLVPKWPTDHEYGWVIPIFSRSDVTCVVQYEPQEQQIYTIPSNTLTFIRPHVKVIYKTILTGSIPYVSAGDYILTTDYVFTVDESTDVFTTNVAHGFISGTRTRFSTTGTLPSGITANTDYYTIVLTPTTFQITTNLELAIAGLEVIDILDAGSGLHRCSDFDIDFIKSGVVAGQYVEVAGIKYTIAVVSTNAITIKEPYPSTSTAVAYTIKEWDSTPIDRLLMSFKGSPNSRVEIRDWQYDGTEVSSVSYYILGTKEAYGQKRWLAGGFSVKPLFYNLAVLRARYSDGVSRYNSGCTYV